MQQHQKLDILLDVKNRANEWIGKYLSMDVVDPHFQPLFDVFKESNFDIELLLNMDSIEILQVTKNCCEGIGLSKFDKDCALECWAADASVMMNSLKDQ
ncbi:hypothetical protein [Acinetobacter sp. YH12239]|uniref:hypothetical protein n=1 Tax=Acinetobacter sp. YH12239 TaxID=2601166 RepID=UPI0015D1B68F|nr:hypothetical protein [Acinetobacter sp. YH12239]